MTSELSRRAALLGAGLDTGPLDACCAEKGQVSWAEDQPHIQENCAPGKSLRGRENCHEQYQTALMCYMRQPVGLYTLSHAFTEILVSSLGLHPLGQVTLQDCLHLQMHIILPERAGTLTNMLRSECH